MNQKTEPSLPLSEDQIPEFSPNFVRVMVGLTIATLFYVFVFEHNILSLRYPGPHNYLYAWVYAAGQTISNGLSEFSGEALTQRTLAERLFVLLSLIIGFIVGPSLFFFGWYERRKERAAVPGDKILKGSGVIFVLGAILTFSTAIPAIPVAFVRAEVERSLRSAQAVQSDKDAMIGSLSRLARSAFQYRVLPTALDGGAGSYIGYVIPASLARTDEGTFSATVSENSIAFLATSSRYPGATVRCTIDQKGEFVPGAWSYTGDFE